MDVLIVIVNYRSASLAIDCLRTLKPEVEAFPGVARVVVTDNASGDGSAEVLATAVAENGWGGWVEVMPLDVNGGFAYGNNAAIRPALASDDPPRYVWMLNPDTLVEPGALRELSGFLDARPDVGLAGSRVANADGSTQWSKFPFPTVATEFEGMIRLGVVTRLFRRTWTPNSDHDRPIPVDWVSGASLMIRREVFDAVGLLDDGYFMYYEEVDFTLRASRAGWPCWFVPSATVVHLVGQSSGVSNLAQIRKRRPGYWFEARRRFFLKNHGRLKTLLADLGYVHAYVFNSARLFVKRRPGIEPRLMLWDFVRHNFLKPKPVLVGSAARTVGSYNGHDENAVVEKVEGLGVVAIGRNEGERLRRCLESLRGCGASVVYVDSDSTDGSVELARSLGVEVVALDMTKPFTAARARNEGFARLVEIDPEVRFVQFLDGDCEAADGWLATAARTLETRPESAVVFGLRRERFPEKSLYNRVADVDWNVPIGQTGPDGAVDACGGDAMIRAKAFREVGGYDPSVPAGEEPELCQRLRGKGWTVNRLDLPMTWHDSAMYEARQWARRQFRTGYGGLDFSTRFGKPGNDPFRKQIRSAWVWSLGWPVALALGVALAASVGGPVVALLAAIGLGLLPFAQMARVAWKNRARAGGDLRAAGAYGLSTMLGKPFQAAGHLLYLRDHRAGRHARLIEYKGPGGQPARA